jgi:site-specific recombinase XerD
MTQTVTDDTADFLTELAREEIAAKTIAAYRADLTHFARWFAGSTGEAFVAAAVTPTDLRDYRAHLISVERRQPATVNRRLAALRRFFLWAKAAGRCSEVVTDGVKGVPASPRSPKSLEKREVDRLVRMAERSGKKRDLALLQTLRHTGLRVGELCDLRLDDIDLSDRRGTLTVRQGKGAKHRTVPLNADVRHALGVYLAVRPRTDDDHLFVGQRGRGVSEQAVWYLVTKYARQAGLEDVSPHTLRHTFGKQLLDATKDLVAVAALLGHEKLETTAIYTQPSERDLARAVALLEREEVTNR